MDDLRARLVREVVAWPETKCYLEGSDSFGKAIETWSPRPFHWNTNASYWWRYNYKIGWQAAMAYVEMQVWQEGSRPPNQDSNRGNFHSRNLLYQPELAAQFYADACLVLLESWRVKLGLAVLAYVEPFDPRKCLPGFGDALKKIQGKKTDSAFPRGVVERLSNCLAELQKEPFGMIKNIATRNFT